MDAALLGGIIGAGTIVACYGIFRIYHALKKRYRTQEQTPLRSSSPHPPSRPPPQIKTPKHWKVKALFTSQKKTLLLKNLNSYPASRTLTAFEATAR